MPPLPARFAFLSVLLSASGVLLEACSNGDGAAALPIPMPASIPGTYAGLFPCGNCAGIDATLWLRTDGRFILRQRYIEDSGDAEESSSYALGLWQWDEVAALVVLGGPGPARKLERTSAGGLALRTDSSLPHVLDRDDGVPPFTEGFPLTGVAVVNGNAATFRDCVSQLELDVAPVGAFAELRRQHRAFSPHGRPALTAVAAYPRSIAAAGTVREVWVLDRVVNVKPNGSC
jgi:copper homeostasis protein (lipoprotein)